MKSKHAVSINCLLINLYAISINYFIIIFILIITIIIITKCHSSYWLLLHWPGVNNIIVIIIIIIIIFIITIFIITIFIITIYLRKSFLLGSRVFKRKQKNEFSGSLQDFWLFFIDGSRGLSNFIWNVIICNLFWFCFIIGLLLFILLILWSSFASYLKRQYSGCLKVDTSNLEQAL